MDQTQDVGLALPNFTSTATQTRVLVLMDQTQDVGLALPNLTCTTLSGVQVPMYEGQTTPLILVILKQRRH